MARSSNKVADGLLASAKDSAVHDGLRLAVPRYLDAVDALIEEDRPEEAASILAELLAAKEKKRGFFLGKREENALGDQRLAVAQRYAQLTRDAAPTEASLDVLNQLALDFPDDVDVRLTNAEALRQSGYLLDALDEFKYCASMLPEDTQLVVRIAELYSQLGQPDEAVARAKRAIALHARSGNDAGVATVAVRMLDYAPSAFEDSLDAFGSLSADGLAKNLSQLNSVTNAFARSDIKEPERRSAVVARVAACYEKLLQRDRSNQALWKSLAMVDSAAADEVRRRLDGKAGAAAPASQQAPKSVTALQPAPEPTPAKPVAAAPSTPPAAAPVERSSARAEGPSAPQSPVAGESPTAAPPVRRAVAAGGLSAFAKRKALELFANSEYEASSVQLERVVKMSPDVEALEMLLECYLVLGRHAEAARVGLQLANAELAAGNRPGAIATLTTLGKKIADPVVEQRRVELMQNK